LPGKLDSTPTRDDAPIRESIEAWVQALRAKDIRRLMEHYAPDMVTFDLMPLQLQGADAYRKNFEAWFAAVEGPIDYEIHDLRTTRRDDVAFSHYVGRVKTTRTTGKKTDYWVRVTMGFQMINARWLVTHEHVSMPFSSREALQSALASPRG
jgi:uncharacterized protein (TIGR02246 family)